VIDPLYPKSDVQKFVLTIAVVNVHEATMKSEKLLTILIEKPNLNFPTFPDRTITVGERHSKFKVIAPIRATDKDSGGCTPSTDTSCPLPSRIVYSIAKDKDDLFTFGNLHGFLALGSKLLDYETSQQHEVTLQACDGGIAPLWDGRLCTNATVTVNVGDANDERPTITKLTYDKIMIPETVKESTMFSIKIEAEDKDGSDPNNQLKYFIKSGNTNGLFKLTDNGTLAAAKDFTAITYPRPVYTLVFGVHDKGVPQLTASETASVNVTVYDKNDNKPQFVADKYTVELDEEVV
jgi:hypothetical protein